MLDGLLLEDPDLEFNNYTDRKANKRESGRVDQHKLIDLGILKEKAASAPQNRLVKINTLVTASSSNGEQPVVKRQEAKPVQDKLTSIIEE